MNIQPTDVDRAQAQADLWREWLEKNGVPSAVFVFGPILASDAWPCYTACLISALAARGIAVLSVSSTMVGKAVPRVAVVRGPEHSPVPLLMGTAYVTRTPQPADTAHNEST